MKTTKLLGTALFAVMAFTACSNDDGVNSQRQEIKIVATIGASDDNRTKATFENDGSGEFEAGDEYTLIAWSQTLSNGGMYRYKIGETSLYWDADGWDGNPIDFIAWYPNYVFGGGYTQFYEVAAAASEDAKDLLIAPKVTVAKGNVVNLQFKHMMHKLVVNLSSNYFSTASLNNAVINLKNLKSSALVDFWNATVDASLANGTESYASKLGAATSFIVAPQTLTTGSVMLEIEIEGKTFVYKVPASLTTLESGKVLTLNLSSNRDAIVLQSSGIQPWGNQDTINADVEEQP
ncbi:fimbrillin family protein [Dysgonomonas sp. UBA7698]|uniref:fimbrillin family protein n=1 Tax=Dysgonomonas sp. UBA7698 TaxID=1946427 RepID=UPI0025C4CE5D|nr:fimbrillin family protein [Dysgonomonas sp. UBA7698]